MSTSAFHMSRQISGCPRETRRRVANVSTALALFAMAGSALVHAATLAIETSARPAHRVAPPPHWTAGTDRQVIIPSLRYRPVMARPGNPAVVLRNVNANVQIVDQVATTTLELTLYNPGHTPQESVMVLPVPEGVTIRAVQYDGTGPEPTATIMNKDEARGIYADIVRSMKDPALVEFVGLNLIQTSVFPIPANSSQTLRITMEQMLRADGNRVDYTLVRSNALLSPSENLADQIPWTMTVEVKSKHPIATIYAPSHTPTVRTESPNHSIITFTGPGTQAGSLRLSYLTTLVESTQPSFTVFACPAPPALTATTSPKTAQGALPSGYFLALGALPSQRSGTPRKRELIMVVDRSGSMRGAKLEQARAASLAVVEGLAEGELFNIIDYSDSIRSFASAPVVKSADSAASAAAYLHAMRAEGGTNIQGALLEALRAAPTPDKFPLILFLTDGLPTFGERSEAMIRRGVIAANTGGRRIFTFGIGYDVNTPLLAGLSDATRATSTFVTPEEDLELSVSRVFRGLSGPVLEVPRLLAVNPADRARLGDVQPAVLPDYYDGDQVIVLGEYSGTAPLTLELQGTSHGEPISTQIVIDPAQASMRHDYVPRLWATRRVGSLIEAVRQAGADAAAEPTGNAPDMKEITDEIIRLSTMFGILTEYTAFLAKDTTAISPSAMPALRAEVNDQLTRRARLARSGAGSVNQDRNINAMKDAGRVSTGASPSVGGESERGAKSAASAPAAPPPAQNGATQSYFDEGMKKVEVASIRQLGVNTFYQRNKQWVDSRILSTEAIAPHQTIVMGTDEYFDLAVRLAARNEQQLLAQEGDILILFDGKQILVQSK